MLEKEPAWGVPPAWLSIVYHSIAFSPSRLGVPTSPATLIFITGFGFPLHVARRRAQLTNRRP